MIHTPGPWIAEYVGSAGPHDNPAGDVYEVLGGKGHHRIAEYVLDRDVFLIAAAPDLLEAMKEILPHLDSFAPSGLFTKAEAAIAKAEGK